LQLLAYLRSKADQTADHGKVSPQAGSSSDHHTGLHETPAAIRVCPTCRGSKVEVETYNFRQMEANGGIAIVTHVPCLERSLLDAEDLPNMQRGRSDY